MPFNVSVNDMKKTPQKVITEGGENHNKDRSLI